MTRKHRAGVSWSPEAGLERVQVILLLAVFIASAVLLGPTLLKKRHAESTIRLKSSLRAFHTANEAYRQRNPEEGYAKDIAELVQSRKKIHYIAKTWLKPDLEGFSIVYQAPELFPRQNFSLIAQKEFLFKSAYCIDHRGVLRSGLLQQGAGELLTADDAGCHGGIEVV